MNAKYAVFGLVAIKPISIREIRSRLPYSAKTIYKNVEELIDEGLLVKIVQNETSVLTVAEGYKAQKLREIVIQCLSHGIDHEMMLRSSTLKVWRTIEGPKTVLEIKQERESSGKWIRNALHFMERNGLVRFLRRNPLLAERIEEHPVNRLLLSYYRPMVNENIIHYPGDIPFEEYLKTPDQVERLLYELIDRNVTVRDTGFTVAGKEGRLAILESVDRDLTVEELFLKKIMTTEGVEDQCILMVSQDIIDHDMLLQLAIADNVANIVGCYLDILHNIDDSIISNEIIERFHKHVPLKKKTFLCQEKEFGKNGWEPPFEERWNVDLYLDLDAIRHGVRGR